MTGMMKESIQKRILMLVYSKRMLKSMDTCENMKRKRFKTYWSWAEGYFSNSDWISAYKTLPLLVSGSFQLVLQLQLPLVEGDCSQYGYNQHCSHCNW